MDDNPWISPRRQCLPPANENIPNAQLIRHIVRVLGFVGALCLAWIVAALVVDIAIAAWGALW